MFQKIQNSPPVPLQETNQDGDQDIQSSQLQSSHQSTGPSHPPTDPSLDHSPLPMETLNHSLPNHSLKLLQITMFQKIQDSLLEPLQETSQDGDLDIQSFQLQFFHQSTLLFHPPTDHLLEQTLPLTEILNPSFLNNSLKLPQITMFQKIQDSPPVPLQETNQDGDQDIQSSQLQSSHQSTGPSHPPTDPSLDHSPLPMETLNHSLPNHSLKLLQLIMFHLIQNLPPEPLQEISQDGDPDIQSFQLQSSHQSTMLFHPLMDHLQDHLPQPTETPNLSLPLELPQTTQFSKLI